MINDIVALVILIPNFPVGNALASEVSTSQYRQQKLQNYIRMNWKIRK